jgi:hypothetical protein
MYTKPGITPAFSRLCSWENLLCAWRKAAKGKRGHAPAATFESRLADSKARLLEWKAAAIERLAHYRLILHEHAAQVTPTHVGIPWLGFVVFPGYRRVKGRKARGARRRLGARLEDYHAGEIALDELDASIRGWINHVRYADSWGLRRSVLGDLVVVPARHARSRGARGHKGQ